MLSERVVPECLENGTGHDPPLVPDVDVRNELLPHSCFQLYHGQRVVVGELGPRGHTSCAPTRVPLWQC